LALFSQWSGAMAEAVEYTYHTIFGAGHGTLSHKVVSRLVAS